MSDMSINEIKYRLQALVTMCVFKDAVGHDLSQSEIKLYIQAKDEAIKAFDLLEKYKDAYHKGYKDGAEAVKFHEELSTDEIIGKLEKQIKPLKRGAEHNYEDGENPYQAEYLKGYICALSTVEGIIDSLKGNTDD